MNIRISTTYVHLVDICHKLNLNFFCVCVCVKRKRSGLLGIFPTFLQFFRQNALFYCYCYSLSLSLRIFSKYLAWNWLTGYCWIGCLCIILRTQNFPITITNFTGCQCSIVNKWLLGNGQYIQMCWDHKASWLFPKASRPNDIVLLQR